MEVTITGGTDEVLSMFFHIQMRKGLFLHKKQNWLKIQGPIPLYIQNRMNLLQLSQVQSTRTSLKQVYKQPVLNTLGSQSSVLDFWWGLWEDKFHQPLQRSQELCSPLPPKPNGSIVLFVSYHSSGCFPVILLHLFACCFANCFP